MSEIVGVLMNSEYEYSEILEEVQKHLSENAEKLINKVKTDFTITNEEDENSLKSNIREFLQDNQYKCKTIPDQETLVNRLFDSMVFFDFLTPYILDTVFIIENGIEEINGNSWDEIYITDKNGTHLSEETFCSPQQAYTILTSLATRLNKTLNEGTPIFLGEIRKNIRIACVGLPITDREKNINFSIRIVSIKDLSRQDLIDYKTYTSDELLLLETCIEYGVSVLFAGATNSGKTATMNYLLDNATQDATKRVGTIEIEAREFNLPKYDGNGKVINNTFSWVTRESMDEEKNVSANDLEELILRFSPEIIGIGEMRNKEAMITCEIATTGHTVITTTHSKNAKLAYTRVVMLCKKAMLGYDDATLYRLAIEAFPIVVFQKFFKKDRSRICTEIIEGIGYENGKVITRTLYKFERDSSINNKITGKHRFKNNISDELQQILIDNGASEDEIKAITKEVKEGVDIC